MRKPRAIKLFWSGGRNGHINFGDTLSPALVEMLSGRRVVYGATHNCQLLAIGSIAERYAQRAWRRRLSLNLRPVSVWGTGTICGGDPLPLRRAYVASVRGPKTVAKLKLNADTPLGDPGLLVDLLLAKKPPKTNRWGIIPHVSERQDAAFQQLLADTKNAILIDMGDPNLKGVAEQIASCDFIASSSLHGLIAADAFGIPNLRLKFRQLHRGGDWKFEDYLASVPGRRMVTMEAPPCLEAEEDSMRFDYQSDITKLKGNALEAFKRMEWT